MLWANASCTSYDVYIATMDLLYGNGKILDVLGSLIKGMTIGMLITCMLTLPVAIIVKPLVMIYGIKDQSELLLEAIEKGDPIEIGVRVLQCITLVYGFGAQCFTGETLVETDEGMVAIEDIEVGDYVLAEDTVTGEQEYKEVLDVHVSQTTKLVHVVTSGSDDNNILFGLDKEESSTTINTTDNHPFYVEGKGWVPAIELEAGDILRTADGGVEVVNDVYVEYLDEPVLIYNLEIEGYHTYFVSDESVLVHNECGPNKKSGKPTRRQSFRQAKEAADIPKSAQYKHNEFVYDGSSENRIVYEFEVNGKSKYVIEHPFDKNGRGNHFHGADDKYGSPYNKGTYNQYDGHFPEDFDGFE